MEGLALSRFDHPASAAHFAVSENGASGNAMGDFAAIPSVDYFILMIDMVRSSSGPPISDECSSTALVIACTIS